MRVDIWSDVVCPWCYLGFTRLDQVLAEYEGEVEVYHHAFELDASAAEPVSAVQYLGEKYGIDDDSVLNMMADVSEAAATEGLQYRLPETLHGNTRTAHRLIAAAATVGLSHALLQRLFAAYFERAESVFAAADLRPHALAVGMDADFVERVLGSDEFADVVAYDQQLADQIGVHSVPFFVFNQKVAVRGAESREVLAAAMAQAETLV